MIELPEGAVVLDGWDDAIIGETTRDGLSVLAYSADEIVGIFIERDGMSGQEALDFYEYNVASLWAGERTPILIWEKHEEAQIING